MERRRLDDALDRDRLAAEALVALANARQATAVVTAVDALVAHFERWEGARLSVKRRDAREYRAAHRFARVAVRQATRWPELSARSRAHALNAINGELGRDRSATVSYELDEKRGLVTHVIGLTFRDLVEVVAVAAARLLKRTVTGRSHEVWDRYAPRACERCQMMFAPTHAHGQPPKRCPACRHPAHLTQMKKKAERKRRAAGVEPRRLTDRHK